MVEYYLIEGVGMKKNYYTQLSRQFIYSLFYSSKKRKVNQFKNHHHTEIELGFIVSGKGEYILNGNKFIASEDDLFIVRSNEQHCIPAIHTDSLIAFNIHLSTYFLWNICSDYIPPQKIQALINSDVTINNKLHDSEIALCIKNIAKLMKSDDDSAVFMLRSEILKVVMIISSKIETDDTLNIPSATHLNDIQTAIDYIKSNYNKQINLSDMAKSATMSQSYFSNTFKAISGMTPYNYLMTTRIEHALESLKNTDKTVISIAFECGFTSITSFNKAFKKLVGIVPSDVRK